MPHSWNSTNLLHTAAHRTQRSIDFIDHQFIIKGTLKDIDEQPGGRDAQNLVQGNGCRVSTLFQCTTLPRFPQVHQSGNSLKLLLLDFLWRLHFLSMLIKSLAVSDWTQSPAPLPSPEAGPGWGLGRVLTVATLISCSLH